MHALQVIIYNFNYSNSIEVIIGFNRNKSYDYSVINESLVNYLE